MDKISKGIYTKEFREEAVKLITEGSIGIKEASNRLSLPPSTLSYWVKAYKGGRIREVGKTDRPLSEMEMELARVKKELAEAKMERDFLKKAAAYFAKESR